MSHGDPTRTGSSPPPPTRAGPRPPLLLGLEATRATQNILRLLEASHGAYSGARDMLTTVWHREGQVWFQDDDGSSGGDGGGSGSESCGWKVAPFDDPQVLPAARNADAAVTAPSLQSLQMSDERTAFVKIQTSASTIRYLSLLRLDPDSSDHHHHHSNEHSHRHRQRHHHSPTPAHDGWQIVREVISNIGRNAPILDTSSFVPHHHHNHIAAIHATLQRYLAVEHGGGSPARCIAESLFASDATLVTIGTAPSLDAAAAAVVHPTSNGSIISTGAGTSSASPWQDASAGQFQVRPLSVYLEGVQTQTPHDLPACAVHDAVVSLDVSGDAAAAVVHVGNGARSAVWVDHLLLGRWSHHHNNNNNGHDDNDSDGNNKAELSCWRILSKTFAPRSWPAE